ncbi:MAG: hypothetical protein JWN57_2051 [Frankiales bacterium]|jgi:hypothetical protein|nr:hypothetical protein [Frankiales bacterium]
MDGRTARLLAAGAACALLLTGCGSDEPAAAPVPSSPPSPAPLPSLSAEQRAELLGVLTSTVPGLTAAEDEVLARATLVCQDIVDRRDPQKIRTGARLRFQAGTAFSLGDEEVDSIIAAVETIWCPAPGGGSVLPTSPAPAASPSP